MKKQQRIQKTYNAINTTIPAKTSNIIYCKYKNNNIQKIFAPVDDAVGDVQKMENEKNNKTAKNKAITIRIDETTLKEYNQKLEQIYETKKHRKQSATIDTLLKQFNKQDSQKLKEYLEKDMPIINLNKDTIQDYQKQIQEKDNTIQNNETLLDNIEKQVKELTKDYEQLLQDTQSLGIEYEQEIQEKDNTIQETSHVMQEKEKHITTLQTTNEKLEKSIQEKEQTYNEQIQMLRDTIKEKEKIITEKDGIIADKEKTIADKDDELKQARNDYRASKTDYKHSNELYVKLSKEFNDIQNENKKYAVAIAEIKKMSLFERIIAKYPEKMLELSDGKDQADN